VHVLFVNIGLQPASSEIRSTTEGGHLIDAKNNIDGQAGKVVWDLNGIAAKDFEE